MIFYSAGYQNKPLIPWRLKFSSKYQKKLWQYREQKVFDTVFFNSQVSDLKAPFVVTMYTDVNMMKMYFRMSLHMKDGLCQIFWSVFRSIITHSWRRIVSIRNDVHLYKQLSSGQDLRVWTSSCRKVNACIAHWVLALWKRRTRLPLVSEWWNLSNYNWNICSAVKNIKVSVACNRDICWVIHYSSHDRRW